MERTVAPKLTEPGWISGLESWAAQRSGCSAVARAVAALAAAATEGHIGMPLARVAELGSTLRASDWVSTDPELRAAPLVLDGERLYLWRHQRAEARVAAALRMRLGRSLRAPATVAPQLLDGADIAQQSATRAAGVCPLQVLTGGPGTGKTSTVVRMLAVLATAIRAETGKRPRLALAAPTGKAAQRLAASVLSGKAQLSALADADESLLAALADVPEQASTLHTALAYRPDEGRFQRGPDDPLPLDALVVDESSMVDLELFDALLQALPDDAALILVGDADQLVSVAPGSVLADLVLAAQRGTQWANVWTQLDRVWRNAGALQALPAAIRGGDHARVMALLTGGQGAIRWQAPADEAALALAVERWLDARGSCWLGLDLDASDPVAVLARLQHTQILCAVRAGAFGVDRINAWIAARVRAAAGAAPESRWYPGRRVMLTRNTHALGLFNGDVGVTLAQADDELLVWFPGSSPKDPPRAYAPRQLTMVEDAWATTVHKAQGSEYEEVLLVLPPDPLQPLLTRELLYTGATRSRRILEVWSTAAALERAVMRLAERDSGLVARLVGV